MSNCNSPLHYGHHESGLLGSCFVFLLSTLVQPHDLSADDRRVEVIRSDGGIVVSDSRIASQIGRDVLLDGGNAVDAAVATAFALAVSWPEAGNIGGGGFMLLRPANGKNPVCVDYRETAPNSMQKDSFTRSDTTFTQKAVGVPGTVRGLALAHAKHGRLGWTRLVMPASQLASQGVPIDLPLAKSLNYVLSIPSVQSENKYSELRRVYGKPDKSDWKAGDTLLLPDLANTLRIIAQEGPDSFYKGSIAKQLVEEMGQGDGEISLQDLDQYKAIVRPAMKGKFHGYTVLGAPPPSSGGTCIIEALNIIENFNMSKWDRYDPQCIHLIAETCRRVFADRARYLGDPKYTRIPEFLTSKKYAREVAKSIDLNQATPSGLITPEINVISESPDTTHFSIVDKNGMAVSNTYTLEASWGSRIVVKGAGFLLNNEMGDFNWFPGETNAAGRIGTKPNTVAAGKRMLSSQSPTMLEKDGKLVLVTGSPGGRTIINTVLGIVLGVTEFSLTPEQAVAGARMHHQWFPDRLDLEALDHLPHSGVQGQLAEMGHQIGNRPKQGSAHTVAIDQVSNMRIGIADRRRSGGPAAHKHDTVARWDFDDEINTQLPQATYHGKIKQQWTNALPASTIDGSGCLTIKSSHPHERADTYLPVNKSAGQIAVELEVRELKFSGDQKNEIIRIGFSNDPDRPIVATSIVLSRKSDGDIVIQGESPREGTAVPATTISQDNELAQPITLRLEINTTRGIYRIYSKSLGDSNFQNHGAGKVATSRPAKFLRLSVEGNFTDKGEVAKIESLQMNWKPDKNQNN
ncbi:MAG: gamma-glutamyltransferase [Saprospirales bacterium TMED214]|nr:MAG: gamma-glutamyltransferase [Saprospirales bacterium TMED214]